MKAITGILALFLGTFIDVTSFAQSAPGPAVGGGIDRLYDDGYVRVDASGNLGGLTWFWGYEDASQIQGDFIVFHSLTVLDATTQELLTDTYALGGIGVPLAPYSGSYFGPGPSISDSPLSRSITIVPEAAPSLFGAMGALILLAGRVAMRPRSRHGIPTRARPKRRRPHSPVTGL